MNKPSITKHNQLIQAGYRLTLNETRILQYGISLINPVLDEFPLEYEINIKKFINFFGLENNTGVYRDIKNTVMGKFREREFTFNVGKEKKEWFRWLIRVTYEDNRGYIKIYLNPFLKPWLHQLKGHFTSYSIDKISSFKSAYSSRIYEIAIMELNKSAKNKHSFIAQISHLKEQLDIIEKYKVFANFKMRVLEPAKREINKYSDIHLSYEPKKQGRAYYEIKFSITKKSPKPELIKNPNSRALSASIIEKAKWLAQDAGTNWNVQEIVKQFLEFSEKKGKPKDIEHAFIGFVNHKIQKAA